MNVTLCFLTADSPVRPTYMFTVIIAVILAIVAFYIYLKKRKNKDDKVG